MRVYYWVLLYINEQVLEGLETIDDKNDKNWYHEELWELEIGEI